MPFLRGALFALLALGCRALETKDQIDLEPMPEPAPCSNLSKDDCIAASGCVVTKSMDDCVPE